jgi:hypothetical protein
MTKEDNEADERTKEKEVLHDTPDEENNMDKDKLKEEDSELPGKEASANEVRHY